MQKLIFILLAIAICTSCVSKKKYDLTLSDFALERDSLFQEINQRQASIQQMNLDLAEKRGAIEALFTTQDKLQDRLDELQLEIDRLQLNSSNRQQDLGSQLSQREATIKQKQAQLAAIKALIEKEQNRLKAISEEVRTALPELDQQQLHLAVTKTYLSIDLQEEVLFTKGSTSRMTKEGQEALSLISEILQKYPEMMIDVIGHTDNRDVNRKSLDNWQYTALRAVSIVEALIQDYNLGTNRVIAASKGEYQPRASNETTEGRQQNRRIEIRIQADRIGLIREIEKALRA